MIVWHRCSAMTFFSYSLKSWCVLFTVKENRSNSNEKSSSSSWSMISLIRQNLHCRRSLMMDRCIRWHSLKISWWKYLKFMLKTWKQSRHLGLRERFRTTKLRTVSLLLFFFASLTNRIHFSDKTMPDVLSFLLANCFQHFSDIYTVFFELKKVRESERMCVVFLFQFQMNISFVQMNFSSISIVDWFAKEFLESKLFLSEEKDPLSPPNYCPVLIDVRWSEISFSREKMCLS